MRPSSVTNGPKASPEAVEAEDLHEHAVEERAAREVQQAERDRQAEHRPAVAERHARQEPRHLGLGGSRQRHAGARHHRRRPLQ
eukprot:1933944-Prymnesium_polylepis.1